jgi:hypothetical protein
MTFLTSLVRLYELGNSNDDASYERYVDELVSPHYTYSDDQTPHVLHGNAAMKANRRVLRAALPDLRVTLDTETAICDARSVAVRWSAAGTFLHDLGPVRATRRSVRYSGVLLARFDAATRQLVAAHGAWDVFALLVQLGVLDDAVNPFRAMTTTTTTIAVRSSSSSSSSVAQTSPSGPPHRLLTRNAWSAIGADLVTLRHGVAIDGAEALAAAAACLGESDVGVALVNYAGRVVRVVWCGAAATRAQRSALSQCRVRLDATASMPVASC